jgi:dephospho-CoA kinase
MASAQRRSLATAMLNLGLTGGIGSGKSAVARMFADLGAATLDSDALVRSFLGPGQKGTAAVAAVFGDDVLGADGAVDRRRLGAMVFGDEEARAKLEGILHPMVIATRREWIEERRKEMGPGAVTVAEAALIFEAGTWPEFDGVVLVTAPVEVRKARLLSAGWDEAEVERRMAAQWTDERKAALSDWIVDNGGDEGATRAQVEVLWKRFTVMALAREPLPKEDRTQP